MYWLIWLIMENAKSVLQFCNFSSTIRIETIWNELNHGNIYWESEAKYGVGTGSVQKCHPVYRKSYILQWLECCLTSHCFDQADLNFFYDNLIFVWLLILTTMNCWTPVFNTSKKKSYFFGLLRVATFHFKYKGNKPI